jgi:hypothetical protein
LPCAGENHGPAGGDEYEVGMFVWST